MTNSRSPEFWVQIKSLFSEAKVMPTVVGRNEATRMVLPADTGGQHLASQGAFDQKLSEIMSVTGTSGAVVTGKVHIINVESVRQRLGERWERLSGHVHKIIAKTLEERLSQHDFFTRYQGDTYVIVFGEYSKEEAKLKSALLAEEIMRNLFGEAYAKDIESLGIKTVVAQVDGSLKAEKVNTVDALAGVLRQAEENEPQEVSQNMPAENVAQPTPLANNLAELFSSIEEQLRSFESTELGDASGQQANTLGQAEGLLTQLKNFQHTLSSHLPAPDQELAQTSNPSLTMSWQAQNVNAIDVLQSLIARAETQVIAQGGQLPPNSQAPQTPASQAMAPPTPAPQTMQAYKPAYKMPFTESQEASQSVGAQPQPVQNMQGNAPAPNIKFFYHPIWHTPKKMVSIYLCQLSLDLGQGVLSYEDILRENNDRDLNYSVDTLIVQKTRQDFQNALTSGFMGAIGLPVHYSTLNWLAGRQKYFDFVSGIPVESRKLVIWEIVKAPHESWRAELAPIVNSISPFGRAVFVRTDVVGKKLASVLSEFRSLVAAKVHAVGLDVNDLAGSQSDILAQLEDFAIAAEEHGLKCYVHGLNTASLNMAAVCAGFHYVSGDAVAKPVDVPQGFQEADTSSVYLKNLQKTGG